MFGFEIKNQGDIVVITVDFSRATISEAGKFKKLIDEELSKKTLKMIIDLSNCEYLDSTFIGVLVVSLKKISEIGGELRLVEPLSISLSTLAATGILDIFNVYKTQTEAIKNFIEL